jgi:tRNA dimethylallyltransferase
MNEEKKVLAIAGPTASGKTELAYRIALYCKSHLNKTAEIISADSRQAYKHIPISASHPPAEYLKNIKHHFVNELELNREFNAGDFGKSGREVIKKLFSEDKIPVIAGGSGLYLRSLIYGLFEFESDDEDYEKKKNEVRNILNHRAETEGMQKLLDELIKVDKEAAEGLDASNSRRILRALEVYNMTGKSILYWRKNMIEIPFTTVQYGLNWERKILYERINRRTDNMIAAGLIDEIKKLEENNYHYKTHNSLNTVGVKEVFDYLDGKISLNEMKELIKMNTRRFAKRQMTWFRKDKNINWIDITSEEEIINLPEKILNKLYPLLVKEGT